MVTKCNFPHSPPGDVKNWSKQPAMTFSFESLNMNTRQWHSALSVFSEKDRKKNRFGRKGSFFPLTAGVSELFHNCWQTDPPHASTIVILTQTQTHSHSVSSLILSRCPSPLLPCFLTGLQGSCQILHSPLHSQVHSSNLSFCLSSLRQSSVAPLLWQLLIQSSHTPLISHARLHSHILSFLFRAVGQ